MYIYSNKRGLKMVPKIQVTNNRSLPANHCLNNAQTKFSAALFNKWLADGL